MEVQINDPEVYEKLRFGMSARELKALEEEIKAKKKREKFDPARQH